MTTRQHRRRIATTGLLAALAVMGLSACGETGTPAGDGTTGAATGTAPSPTSTDSGTPTPAPTTPATTGQLANIPVYWVAESRRGFALYREFRTVPDAGGPVASAVAAMTRMAPLDPDYVTPWRPASRVTVSQSGDALRVDLSADALANRQVGSELAERAVQQLVYTATAAAHQAGTPASTVTITVDGEPAEAWGVVRLGEPTRRAAPLDVQAHAWVTSPQEGDVLQAGRVTVTGFGTSFEATFAWAITDSSGAQVARGSAMGGTGDGGFGELSFSAQLRPGTYTVELATDDPSGGAEGFGPSVDDKTFTVR